MTWRLDLGDCLTGMAAMPDKSVDHVVSDPPFEKEAHTLMRRLKRTGAAGAAVLSVPLDFDALTPEVRGPR